MKKKKKKKKKQNERERERKRERSGPMLLLEDDSSLSAVIM